MKIASLHFIEWFAWKRVDWRVNACCEIFNRPQMRTNVIFASGLRSSLVWVEICCANRRIDAEFTSIRMNYFDVSEWVEGLLKVIFFSSQPSFLNWVRPSSRLVLREINFDICFKRKSITYFASPLSSRSRGLFKFSLAGSKPTIFGTFPDRTFFPAVEIRF